MAVQGKKDGTCWSRWEGGEEEGLFFFTTPRRDESPGRVDGGKSSNLGSETCCYVCEAVGGPGKKDGIGRK